MKELKLRGYVTPADCGADVQAALDLAAQLQINKVVLTENYTVEAPLCIPCGMYLVLENCVLNARLETPKTENYSFRETFITIEGNNATVIGGIHIFNVHHIQILGLQLQGDMTFEYTLWGNVRNIRISDGSLKVGRGCGNFIIQNLDSQTPAYIDGSISCGKYIPGTKPDLNSIVLQESKFSTQAPAVQLGAAQDCGIMNIQVDHIQAPVTAVQIGDGSDLPDHLLFNLTLTDLDAPEPVRICNTPKHLYYK